MDVARAFIIWVYDKITRKVEYLNLEIAQEIKKMLRHHE